MKNAKQNARRYLCAAKRKNVFFYNFFFNENKNIANKWNDEIDKHRKRLVWARYAWEY